MTLARQVLYPEAFDRARFGSRPTKNFLDSSDFTSFASFHLLGEECALADYPTILDLCLLSVSEPLSVRAKYHVQLFCEQRSQI